MESKRERILLLGAIPIAAAIIGAIVTVIAQHFFSADVIDDQVKIVLMDKALNAQEKMKMLELLEKRDDSFWTLLIFLGASLTVPVAVLARAFADKISRS